MFKGGATVALSLNAYGMLIFGNDPKVVGGGQASQGIPTSMLVDELLRRQQNFEVAHARSKIAKACRADTPAKERVVAALVSEQAEELPVGGTEEILQEALDQFMCVLMSASQLGAFDEPTDEDEKSSVPALTAEVFTACNETSDADAKSEEAADAKSEGDASSADLQGLVSKLSEISSPEDLATLVQALRDAKTGGDHDAGAGDQNGFDILDNFEMLHGAKTGRDLNPPVTALKDPREEMWMPRLLRQHLRATDGQAPGSYDLMDAYESPVIPEVDVVERPVRGSVPELVSDSGSDQSEETPDESLFDSLQSSLESYRIAEKELLRRRNQYRDLQNQAAERDR